MINNSTSIYKDDFIFCPPPLGKPNPNLPIDLKGRTPRKRVLQKAQKGSNCSDFAMNIIRMRIGKQPPKELEEARIIEKFISNQRKLHIENDKQSIVQFAQELTEDYGKKYDKNAAQKLIKDHKTALYSKMKKEFDALEAFCNQDEYEDFYTFALNPYLQKKLNLYEQAFKDLNLNLQENLDKNLLYQGLEWQELDLATKVSVYAGLFFSVSYSKYGLKKSSWTPEQPINQLIEELKLHGPHLVIGSLGRVFYKDAPFKLTQKVAERSIFGWKPNAERIQNSDWSHAVVIIGARSDKNYVYFIDPLDDSDPNDKESQKVYVMSYEKFKKHIYTLEGVSHEMLQAKNVNGNNCALYGNPEENYL